ncbi:MAG: hypothetical protein ACRDU4_09355, partial [Mycobacterium sp.]
MTVDPANASLETEVAWTTFTRAEDIPDWIPKAYIDTYRGA